MDNKIFNKTNLIIFLFVLLVLVVLAWLVLPGTVALTVPQEMKPRTKSEAEHFDSEAKQEELVKDDKNKPFVDPKTGTLIDGPGFERGDVEGVSQEMLSTIPSNYYFIDDGADGKYSIQHNLCSKSCCSSQWPVGHKLKYDPYVCQNKDKFVPSQIFCNNTFQDSGCLCLTKDQSKFLMTRGTNGSEFF